MAQRASYWAWSIIRRILFGLGGVAVLALLVHMVAFVATRSPDAREKLYLSVLDKLFLGVAAAGVGYWLQQRLEIFKRNQAFASELVKLRIAAYNRVLAAVSVLDNVGSHALNASRDPSITPELLAAAIEEQQTAVRAVFAALRPEDHLLSPDFSLAVSVYSTHISGELAETLDGTLSREDILRSDIMRLLLHRSIWRSLPPFAKLPDDEHFTPLPSTCSTSRASCLT